LIVLLIRCRLADAARKVDTSDAETLRLMADHLRRLGAVSQSCDIYRRLGDDKVCSHDRNAQQSSLSFDSIGVASSP